MTIAFVAEGPFVTFFGDVSPSTVVYPAGMTVGNKLLLEVMTGSIGNGAVTTPAGWDLVSTVLGGDPAAYATNAGPRRMTVFERIVTGAEPADFSVPWDSASGIGVFGGQVTEYSRTESSWGTTLSVSGEDTTPATGAASFDVTAGGNLAVAPGDMLAICVAASADNLLSAPAVTMAGATFSAVTERESTQTSGRGSLQLTTAVVATGTVDVAPRLVCDHLGDPSGGVAVFVRLREGAPPPPAPVSYPIRSELYF